MQLPSSILDDIRSTIQSGYYERLSPVRRERKSLCEKLEREMAEGRLPLILEVATARPGGRLILPCRATACERLEKLALASPSAMSVWVEPRHMAGDLRWLARERPFPVVARDLIIDPRQIVGGDAIVLSRPLLELAGFEAHPLIEAAHDLDMEVVMEVRTAQDMTHARGTEADAIAIHNSGANGNAHGARPHGAPSPFGAQSGFDINTTLSLLSAHRTTRPVISCAGIRTPSQVRSLISAGAAAVELDAETTAGADGLDIVELLKKAVNGKGGKEGS